MRDVDKISKDETVESEDDLDFIQWKTGLNKDLLSFWRSLEEFDA